MALKIISSQELEYLQEAVLLKMDLEKQGAIDNQR